MSSLNARPLVSPGEPPCTGAGGWRRGGACGAIPPEDRGLGGRTGTDASRAFARGREACVQEARPPCTTTGLWQATLRSGERRKGLRLSRRAGPGRTEIAAWDARELASYLQMSWRPGVPLPSSQDETRFLN